jgi:hypothetical protein
MDTVDDKILDMIIRTAKVKKWQLKEFLEMIILKWNGKIESANNKNNPV